MEFATQPDWKSRMPGEQWVVMDSPASAETYLATYNPTETSVIREDFPNPQGLYARIRFHDRIPQDRVYVFSN